MTEEEKIFAGKMFDPRRQELKDLKHKAHEACRKYNAMDEYDPGRGKVLRAILGRAGKACYFQGPVQFNYNVCFGPNVSLMATNHPLPAQERTGLDGEGRTTMAEFAREIRIGNGVWLACNVVVLDGVTIGDGAVIGAGSVVTKDIPAGWLAFGNPCRPIRPITEADSRRELILEEDLDHFAWNLST